MWDCCCVHCEFFCSCVSLVGVGDEEKKERRSNIFNDSSNFQIYEQEIIRHWRGLFKKYKSFKSSVTALCAQFSGKSCSCYSFVTYSVSVTIPLHIIIQIKLCSSNTRLYVSQVQINICPCWKGVWGEISIWKAHLLPDSVWANLIYNSYLVFCHFQTKLLNPICKTHIFNPNTVTHTLTGETDEKEENGASFLVGQQGRYYKTFCMFGKQEFAKMFERTKPSKWRIDTEVICVVCQKCIVP